MKSIVYVGMDVHKLSFTLSCFSIATQETFATTKIEPSAKAVKGYLTGVSLAHGKDCEFVCGYEAGCLGYTLYHQLTDMSIKCVIMAPTTILRDGKRVKTDSRDAENLARCLAYGGYKSVYIPTPQDEAVRDYLRMRDDHKRMLKTIKQQINAFCLKHDKVYPGRSKWTGTHIKWLEKLEFDSYLQDAFNEYMITYRALSDKIERLDAQIEKLADLESYRENIKKLICFRGIKTHTALSLIVEVGDFTRFETAAKFASYLGLTPGEHSSSEDIHRLGITKAGNRHLRMLLTEATQNYDRGTVGKKSKALKARQNGAAPEVIAYADKAAIRLRKRFISMTMHSKKHNISKTAVARELACFIWGMMTGNIA